MPGVATAAITEFPSFLWRSQIRFSRAVHSSPFCGIPGGSKITLVLVALVAACIPARRAFLADPIEALRYE
jgi:hypothetical protein